MIRQHFILPQYSWDVWVYYAVTCYHPQEIIAKMNEIGCSRKELQKAWRNLEKCELNTGLTYTNNIARASVVVIALTDSPEQFQNSLDHEKGHLCKHIVQAININPYGEEAQYLAGSIGQKMFKVAKLFMCEHCRKQNNLYKTKTK